MPEKNELAELNVYLADEDATIALARQLAPMVLSSGHSTEPAVPGRRIHLKGDLGAGKTSFARALLRACGVTGRIKSPSYALLETYKLSNLYFYHLDFYRFSDPQDWIDAGFRDILQEDAVILIEWPEQAGSLLPPPDLEIHFSYAETGRHVRLTAYSNKGQLWLTSLTLPPTAFPGADHHDADS